MPHKKPFEQKMKTLVVLLLCTYYTYAYVEESALNTLQTLDHWNTFRIILPHTAEECFYLDAKLHDTIHVIYQVLKGGDSSIRAIITDPFGNATFADAKSPFGWYDEESAKVPGAYRLCFKNEQFFTTKILYIAVLAVHKDRLLQTNIKADQENATAVLDAFSATAMKSLGDISATLYRVTAYQTIARVHDVHDLYWVEANQSYVQNWAICQIVALILCSVIQVFSIRRLFKSTLSKKNSRPQTFQSQSSPHFFITH